MGLPVLAKLVQTVIALSATVSSEAAQPADAQMFAGRGDDTQGHETQIVITLNGHRIVENICDFIAMIGQNAFGHPTFRNFIDADLCEGCGLCVQRCQMDAIISEDKNFRVDLDRCIGCGLCVTRCKPEAVKLIKKAKVTVPPMNTEILYLSILMERAGRKKMIVNMLRLLLGKPL